MTHRVSIVTPSYNQADYLEQTIQSVLQQGYPDLEYMIVDGGSQDGSQEIIRKYSSHLEWWVSEPDSGQAEAINKGMSRATGEYVAWLNSDDLYAPGAVAEAVAVLDQHPEVGLVYGNAVSIDPDGRPLNDLVFSNWGLPGLAAFQIICQPAVFMRRALWEAVGGLDLSYHLLLDHQLWLRMGSQAQLKHVPRTWAFARHHPAAKNVSLAEGFGREAYRILDWMETDPVLAEILGSHRRAVTAAAHRFNARYLLDGGKPGPALRAYIRALRTHPQTAMQEWHRILFAGLSLVGLGRLGAVYYNLKQRRLPASMQGVENVNLLYNPPADQA
jgi:glycosyltransferase involved in cell wall biosynthesis